jgi:hypothetical protein
LEEQWDRSTVPEEREVPMASMFTKLTQLANSPKGKEAVRQMTEKAQQMAKDPKTRAKIDEARRRFQGGRGQGPTDRGWGTGH